MADTTQIELEQELLRIQMDVSREALTQKIEMLEEKVTETVQNATASVAEATATVMETVQSATTSVTDTVDSVTSAVQDTVDTVRHSVEGTVDSVKDAFDINRQFKQHPWLMFAGAIAAGYVGGTVLQGTAKPVAASPSRARANGRYNGAVEKSMREQSAYAISEPPTNGYSNGTTPTPAVGATPPGWLNQVGEAFAPEISKLQNLAIGVMLGSVRDMIIDNTPEGIRQPLTQVIDDFTEKLGGKCVHGSLSTPESANKTTPGSHQNQIGDYR